MAKWNKLAHVVYQCSYHIVWTPQYRYRILEGDIAKAVEEKIRAICEWKGAEILELNVMKDHVHIVVSIPPRVSISELMGILKGERAIVRCSKASMSSRRSRIGGNHFWSRGYCGMTGGMDQDKIRRYVKYQKENELTEEKNSKEYGLF